MKNRSFSLEPNEPTAVRIPVHSIDTAPDGAHFIGAHDTKLQQGATKLHELHVVGRSYPSPTSDLATTFLDHFQSVESTTLPSSLWDRALLLPAREFLERQGKGVRKTLVNSAYQMCGGISDSCSPDVLAVVELLHAASLVLDDIEDESTTRRGRPTLHHLIGTPVALNTGCAMYFTALDILSHLDWPPERLLLAIRAVHRCLVLGHQGQALDLTAQVWDLKPHQIRSVVYEVTERKTSALMAVCARLGALETLATATQVEAAAALGQALGMVLQMLDDLGSLVRPERRDKGCEDLRHGRPVWPWAWLCEVAEPSRVVKLLSAARDAQSPEDLDPVIAQLVSATASVGRQHVHRVKSAALTQARASLGPSAALTALADMVDVMEKSYA